MTNQKFQNSCNLEVKLDKEDKAKSVKRLFCNNRNEDRGDILTFMAASGRAMCGCHQSLDRGCPNAKSNRFKALAKALAAHKHKKKKKHLKASCLKENVGVFLLSWCLMVVSLANKKPESCQRDCLLPSSPRGTCQCLREHLS